MIRIQQIKCPVGHSTEDLLKKIYHTLKIRPQQLVSWHIVRRSLDARKKPELYYSYMIDCKLDSEKTARKCCNGRTVLQVEKKKYSFPASGSSPLDSRPVIAGSGPAGLFCAYMLAKAGYAPVVLERGAEARERQKVVEEFWETGRLKTQTNVQFGEGGAGTFSDGKLNTSVKDPFGRNRLVLETFVRFGAPESILYEQKPHIGTDVLIDVVTAMRNECIRLGADFYFTNQLTDLRSEKGALTAIEINHSRWIDTQVLVMAIGHSARDTFFMLHDRGVAMEAKAFAIGVRIEHPQEMIDLSQYGRTDVKDLGPASYKLTHTTASGRGIYSFCMCPGGYVVNASSEEGRLAVNGMSYHARDSRNANSAMVVTVQPSDYEQMASAEIPAPLKGVDFQRHLEETAFAQCNGKIPVQLFGDFCEGRASTGPGEILPCTRGAFAYSDLHPVLPLYVREALAEGIHAFGKKIRGFDRPDCLLDGLESRTSSPVRMPRDEQYESNISGIYPCGEGAGYAGGITSAAMDGIRVAEAIAKKYMKIK